MPEAALATALFVFLAVVVQSVLGFGLALVAMPLLVGVVGLQQAAPLVALVGITSQIILMLQYRRNLVFSDIKPLAIGSVVGIPLGVLLLKGVDEALATTALGIFLALYALFSLFSPRLPSLSLAGWGYGFGFVSGLITGAYNTGGPVMVVYGDCRRWSPDGFRGNMQALVFIHSVTVLVSHAAVGSLTGDVIHGYLLSIPAILLGIGGGYLVSRRLGASVFRKLVPLALLALGLRLTLM